MPLDEGLVAFLGDKLECVDAEPVHLAIVSGEALIS